MHISHGRSSYPCLPVQGRLANAHQPGPIHTLLTFYPDAAWILSQYKSGLGVAFLANDCGVGKTLTILLSLAHHTFNRISEVQDEGFTLKEGEKKFRPSLVFLPPATVQQFQEDWARWFRGKLHLYVCYGTDGSVGRSKGAKHLKDTNELTTLQYQLMEQSDSPSVSA